MKTSFNIGLVEVESCIISETIFATTFFDHRSVLSPSFQFYIKIFIHVISQKTFKCGFSFKQT
jgi:hypothetical protein